MGELVAEAGAQEADSPLLALAAALVTELGLDGPGRVEIDVDQGGRVRGIWKHEKTFDRDRGTA